jgi:Zn-dependent protease with chaperone function/tetratricopeptide (TPR) repeat protein
MIKPNLLVLLLFLAAAGSLFPSAGAQEKDAKKTISSAQEVSQLLINEPPSVDSWPAWRARLLDWMGDESRQTEGAFTALTEFMRSNADAAGELPEPLARDALAWYLLGRAHMRSEDAEHNVAAERAIRRSISLDNQFGRAHRNLAIVLLVQADPNQPERAKEAGRELALAKQLDPTLKLAGVPAQAALERRDMQQAELLFANAYADEPEISNAIGLAVAVVSNDQHNGSKADSIGPLVERFPQDGTLGCFHAVALAMDNNAKAAAAEFKRVRSLGADPATVLPPDLVTSIEQAARPSPLVLFGWTMVAFVVVYALVIAAMAGAGVVLAGMTRGTSAQRLLSDQPLQVVPQGQVVRTAGEPWLARVYALSLVCGLVLFYVALPFVALGLLATVLGLLWLIFQANRIPIKLIALIVIVGFGMIWSVIKSMFARPGTGSFGLQKSPADCPRLFDTLQEVARRVDTSPVDELYIGPGSEIGVHQEGRGPFGMFGTKRRVLTLGLSSMRSLTVDELKSVLAHEYAHFSHQDTFFSRFIHSVDLSIDTALSGMGAAGGKVNYVNPFFWFLYLYYRAYSLLSAGYSRSREFLADRMACSLYGSNVFERARTKVGTDGPLFESTMYSTVSRLVAEQKSIPNIYEAFAELQKTPESAEQREKIREELLENKKSLFASHPTYLERIDAVHHWPKAQRTDDTSALQLFEDPAAMERELTEFVTGVFHLAHHQAAAAAAEGG